MHKSNCKRELLKKEDKKTLPALTNLHIQRASADTRLYIGADQGRMDSQCYTYSKKKKENIDLVSTLLYLRARN